MKKFVRAKNLYSMTSRKSFGLEMMPYTIRINRYEVDSYFAILIDFSLIDRLRYSVIW